MQVGRCAAAPRQAGEVVQGDVARHAGEGRRLTHRPRQAGEVVQDDVARHAGEGVGGVNRAANLAVADVNLGIRDIRQGQRIRARRRVDVRFRRRVAAGDDLRRGAVAPVDGDVLRRVDALQRHRLPGCRRRGGESKRRLRRPPSAQHAQITAKAFST